MTVAELFAQLSAAMQAGHGQLEVVVRAEDDNGSDYCGTIGQAQMETAKEGETFFAIDCGPEDSDDFEGDEEGAGDEAEGGDEGDETEETDEADEEQEPQAD